MTFALLCLGTLVTACTGFKAAQFDTNVSSSFNAGTANPAPVQQLPPAGVDLSQYNLTFNDEFLINSVSAAGLWDGSKWYNGTDQCCMGDSTGLPGVMFPTVVNGQSVNPYSLIPGGGLNITLSKVNNVWYSGVMTSVDRNGQGFSQQYGYIEFRAKLPAGLGTWPAFWLLNKGSIMGDQSNVGEIDVFEQYGQFPSEFCTTIHDWSGGSPQFYKCGINVGDMTTAYHTWGFLWTESTSAIFFDGNKVAEFPTTDVMKQPYYMLVDLGLGGGWPTDQTPSSATMQVQYIRVYQHK